MSVKKIKVKNFRSFKELEINLNEFNVLIGANASGKSNFVQIFKFLSHIIKYNLKNAISLQGGFEYLRNVNIEPSLPLSIKIVSEHLSLVPIEMINQKKDTFVAFKSLEEIYEFSLIGDEKNGFKITKDILTLNGEFIEFKTVQDDEFRGFEEDEVINKGKVIFSKENKKISREVLGIEAKEDDFSLFMGFKIKADTLLLENSEFLRIVPSFGANIFEKISVYDFDPRLPKKAVPITSTTELEEDGNNLAVVLNNIFKDEIDHEIFSSLMKNILPFVNTLNVEKSKDDNYILKLKETCSSGFFPASLMSDGTINITALITALYFGDKPLILIEEPEKNIHPHLISKLTAMMEEASKNKQIIVTTHNPELIKHIKIENIMLISRDKNGFSTISHPHKKEDVRVFLENKIGIEKLYIRDLLG